MPVVRGRDADGIDVRIFKNAAEIVFHTAFIRLVSIVDLLGGVLRANLIAIANADNLHRLIEGRV